MAENRLGRHGGCFGRTVANDEKIGSDFGVCDAAMFAAMFENWRVSFLKGPM